MRGFRTFCSGFQFPFLFCLPQRSPVPGENRPAGRFPEFAALGGQLPVQFGVQVWRLSVRMALCDRGSLGGHARVQAPRLLSCPWLRNLHLLTCPANARVTPAPPQGACVAEARRETASAPAGVSSPASPCPVVASSSRRPAGARPGSCARPTAAGRG